jgi:chemotaxis protein MotB
MTYMRLVVPLLPLLSLGTLNGCVTTGTYSRKITELEKLRAEHEADLTGKLKERDARIAAQEKRVADLEARLKETDAQLATAMAEKARLGKDLDGSTALVGELKKKLQKLGQNVEKLTGERGQLKQGLEEARVRLEELRKQKAAAEARAQVFRNLVARLRSMIDAGQLKVVIRDGRMLISLPNDVLFDSGKTAIKPDGKLALGRVAQVLAGISDRKFLVAGHTDSVPIRNERFPSNWELSTARAVVVTHFLIASGMRPASLAAAGYGEFDPVASNDTPEQRALNRRIEIVLQPNISDLPSLDEVGNTPGIKPAPARK